MALRTTRPNTVPPAFCEAEWGPHLSFQLRRSGSMYIYMSLGSSLFCYSRCMGSCCGGSCLNGCCSDAVLGPASWVPGKCYPMKKWKTGSNRSIFSFEAVRCARVEVFSEDSMADQLGTVHSTRDWSSKRPCFLIKTELLWSNATGQQTKHRTFFSQEKVEFVLF